VKELNLFSCRSDADYAAIDALTQGEVGKTFSRSWKNAWCRSLD